ncbi:retrovirus-related Pol polyprotein from transposon 412 [Trichonephila clavipes]|nr:retrovirus-related Pol polyprotein from transposon 412 [Trichonephila clavipes]
MEVELDRVFGHVITKATVLRDSLDQGKYLLGNMTAALFEEEKNKERQFLKSNLIKLSRKDFAEEQMKSAKLKTLFDKAKRRSSKKNRYIVENNLPFSQKEDKDGAKRKCLFVSEKYRKNLMTIGHETAAQLIWV